MPHEHLPGPRARLLRTAVETIAAGDPDRLCKADGSANTSAVARILKTTPATVYKMVNGQLPLNLEVLTALAVYLGSWQRAINLVLIVGEDGEPIPVAVCESECACADERTLVAA